MAITHYIRDCKYAVGGLAKYIYLIPKDNLNVNIKAKRQEVRVINESENVYKINASQCVYNQEETYEGRFRFQSTLEVTVSEQWEAPFFYGLKNLRENQFYIIIEDKQGIQYLVNPELFTSLTYEYTFTDGNDEQDGVVLTFVNLSNHPLMILDEKVTETRVLFENYCKYNIGHSITLRMASHKDLEIQDDGVKVTSLNIDDYDKLKRVDFLPESFEYIEHYDGTKFTSTLIFSIPLDDYQYYWSYDLIEFADNVYKALIHTSNNNYIIAGNELGLFPSYKISTGEEDDEPNLVTFTFKQVSQYPSLYTNDTTMYKWIEDGELCFGFNKYEMWKKLKSTNFGKEWEDTDPLEKKKGDLIEINSVECGYTSEKQWEETDDYTCSVQYVYEKWENVNGFVCENNNKYRKTRRYVTIDSGKTWTATNEYGRGGMIEQCSRDCGTVAVRWVDDGYGYLYVDDQYTYTTSTLTGTTCSGTTKMNAYENIIHYSADGIKYIDAKDEDTYDVNEIESCDCGYYYWEGTRSGEFYCGYELNQLISLQIVEPKSGWSIEGNQLKYLSPTTTRTGQTSTSIQFSADTDCKITATIRKVDGGLNSTSIRCYLGKLDNSIATSSSTYYSVAIYSSSINEGTTTFNAPTKKNGYVIAATMYRTSSLSTYDNARYEVILTFEPSESSKKYKDTSKYEKILGYKYCKGERIDPTEIATIQYALVEDKCYECGYKSAKWVLVDENNCGNALPTNTEIVDNVDTEKEEDYDG